MNTIVSSIHPEYKQDIADRLYTEAMIVAYNRTDMLTRRGPFPSGFTEVVDMKTVIISYANSKTTIEMRTNNGFEVCQCRLFIYNLSETMQMKLTKYNHVYIDSSFLQFIDEISPIGPM